MDKVKLTKVRKAATQDFLVAYELRKKMAQIDTDDIVVDLTPEEAAAAREECAKLVRPFDGDVAAGQVRALSGVKEITYALVARQWDERSWLVIPFSSFSVPATDTELKLKVDGGLGLRVVQLWNARSLLTETVAKGWHVHMLPDEDVVDVVSAWEWSVGVAELSEDQLARTGLPIMRRNDPRIAYEDESLANFAELDAVDFAANERQSMVDFVRQTIGENRWRAFRPSPVFEKGYALAAAPATKPVSANCNVDGLDGAVHVHYSPADGHLMLRVFGSDGARSKALDGWGVFGQDATLLGTIEDATFAYEFKDGFDGVLVLVDEEGALHPLQDGAEATQG